MGFIFITPQIRQLALKRKWTLQHKFTARQLQILALYMRMTSPDCHLLLPMLKESSNNAGIPVTVGHLKRGSPTHFLPFPACPVSPSGNKTPQAASLVLTSPSAWKSQTLQYF